MSMRERAELLDQAQKIAEQCIAESRDLTPGEMTRIDALLKQAEEVGSGESAKEKLERLARITHPEGSGVRAYLAPVGTMARELAAAIEKTSTRTGTYGSKALLVAGDVYATVPTLTADPFAQPRPPASLIDALPVGRISSPTFTYLRETTRTNNAAAVAVAGTKPTSVYGLTQYDGKLRVIAHVSEAFDEYWVQDAAGLSRFLEAEMVYGLRVALESQVLNGSGVDPNMTGIANTSGIQVQAFDTSMFTSCRKAVTKAEVLGFTPQMFVMAAADWEAMELAAFTSGNYVLNAEGQGNLPVDAAARRLWGIPVVLSTAQAAGGCYLISAGSVELVTDGQTKVQTSSATNDDFIKNQLRMRVEGRWELAVTSPAGIVSVDLAA